MGGDGGNGNNPQALSYVKCHYKINSKLSHAKGVVVTSVTSSWFTRENAIDLGR